MCRKTAVLSQKSGGKRRNHRVFGRVSTKSLKFSKRWYFKISFLQTAVAIMWIRWERTPQKLQKIVRTACCKSNNISGWRSWKLSFSNRYIAIWKKANRLTLLWKYFGIMNTVVCKCLKLHDEFQCSPMYLWIRFKYFWLFLYDGQWLWKRFKKRVDF